MKQYFWLAWWFLVPWSVSTAAEERPLIVVELFTSQGCSSCLPADVFLGELTRRGDILALSLHVGYWDYMGWNDPFALAATVQRQQAYRNHFGLTYVYTPQLVIHGMADLPGTSLEEAREAIRRAQKTPAVPLSITRQSDGSGLVEAGSGPGEGTVWRVIYDRHQRTLVKGGENGGRHLVNYNIVRRLEPMGRWSGQAAVYPIASPAMSTAPWQGMGVFIQSEPTGAIQGAAILPPQE
ncbi:MAG: hypothetical protein FD149_1583 [Rhodospirillaceae bacterium]|nr:MAG: hypothetical protein FD149_1583 [Rhodospirillaceae bacterium]